MTSIDPAANSDGRAAPDSLTPGLDAARDAILDAALPAVVFDGWTLAALREGCAAAGYGPDMAVRAFPGGVIDAIEHFIVRADRQMLSALATRDLASMRVRDRIAAAVRTRLEQHADHREAIRRASAILALPMHGPVSLRSLYRTVDAMWHAAGDRSTDFNFYTKRGLLAAVYTATLLYWLRDDSENFAASWAFLDRRIETVMRFGKATGQVGKAVARLPDPFAPVRVLRGMAEQAGAGLSGAGAGLAGGSRRRRVGAAPVGTGFTPLAGMVSRLTGGWVGGCPAASRPDAPDPPAGAGRPDDIDKGGPGDAPD